MSGVRTFIAIAVLMCAWASPTARASTFSAVELPPINVGDGVTVTNLPYGQVSPGGRWMLDIGAKRDMVVMTDTQSPVAALTQEQVVVLVGRAFDEIDGRHDGRVDVIKVQASMISSLSDSIVNELRSSSITDNLVVENKSQGVTRVLAAALIRSEMVGRICLEAMRVGRKCSKPAVRVNPVAFDPRYLGRRWGEVKGVRDSGLKSEALDFSIALEKE